MSEITFENVKKTFSDSEVVKGINLSIFDGEFVVIVGPSGCGKSTCLRMIAGLESISNGSIRISGRIVNHLEPKDRDIAMVFQNYALYPHMTVYKNMAYGLKNKKIPKSEITNRINKAVDMLQLDPDMLSRKPRSLSGGQRQRVAMGRAIVREPNVFLFDEPLSNLDAKLRVHMRIEIQRLHKLLGITTVYVTHDQVEAMTLAQKLVVMNNGCIEQVGSPHEIYSRPETLHVATFIGSPEMNLFSGSIKGATFVTEGGIRWTIDYWVSSDALANHSAILGIRPEHLSYALNDQEECEIIIDIIEDLGADQLIHGHIEDGTKITVRESSHRDFKINEIMPIKRTYGAVSHLFNADNGQRIN